MRVHSLATGCRLGPEDYPKGAQVRRMFGEGNGVEASPPWRPVMGAPGTQGPRYEKGDRVWIRGLRDPRLPGVVIGHHLDWNLYRIVYMVDLGGREPRAVEEWRLSPRREGEER